MTMAAGTEEQGWHHWWQRREEERQAQAAQVGALLQQLNASLGGLRSSLLAPPPDDLLFGGTAIIGADGTWRHHWPQPFASVALYNATSTSLTVTGAVASQKAPTQGGGVAHVPAYSYRVVALRGTELVVFGTAGTIFDVEVFLRQRPPAAGSWGAPSAVAYATGLVSGGVVDNHAVLQAQLTALHAAGGGTLFLPAGTFAVSQSVVVPSACILAGSGLGAINIGAQVWPPAAPYQTAIGPTAAYSTTHTGVVATTATGSASQVRTLWVTGTTVAKFAVAGLGTRSIISNVFGCGGTKASIALVNGIGQAITCWALNGFNALSTTTGLSFYIAGAAGDSRLINCTALGTGGVTRIMGPDFQVVGGHFDLQATKPAIVVTSTTGGTFSGGTIFDAGSSGSSNTCLLEVLSGPVLISGCRALNIPSTATKPMFIVKATSATKPNLIIQGLMVASSHGTHAYKSIVKFTGATVKPHGCSIDGIYFAKGTITASLTTTTKINTPYTGGTPSYSHAVVYAGTVQPSIG